MIDKNAAKKMVVLSGMYASQKRGIARQQLNKFFEDVMGVQIRIEDHYMIGNNLPKDIVIICATITEKKQIFQHIESIKHLVNKDGNKYIFRDFLTAKQQQFKRKGQVVADFVNTLEPVEQEEVSTYKGDIYVGDSKYEPKIVPPDPTKVLQMSLPDLNRVMGKELNQGHTIEKESNFFTPYSVDVKDFSEINDAYMKIRLNHAGARHIVCAWSIPGKKIYECNDYCDDDDHGVGKVLLDILLDNNITAKAVFVVRKCGQKLNNARMGIYAQAAYAVLQQFPYNTVLAKHQEVSAETEGVHPVSSKQVPTTYANVTKGLVKTPPTGERKQSERVQGGGRGTGRGRGGAQRRGRGVRRGSTRGRGGRGGGPQTNARKKLEQKQYEPPSEDELTGYKFAEPDEMQLD